MGVALRNSNPDPDPNLDQPFYVVIADLTDEQTETEDGPTDALGRRPSVYDEASNPNPNPNPDPNPDQVGGRACTTRPPGTTGRRRATGRTGGRVRVRARVRARLGLGLGP